MRCGSPTTGRSLLALATLVVAGAAGLLGVLRAAPASAAGSCVAVMVDFRQLGGSVKTGCAQGDPSNGLQAMSKAGFGFTPRPRDGLICQIDAMPACTDTTSSTYWSYWYRAAGSNNWVYANEGAGTHNPKPGSTEAWVWQDGGKTRPPGIAATTICPQLKASPVSTTTPTPTHASGGGAGSSATGSTSKNPKPSTSRTTGTTGKVGRSAGASAAAPNGSTSPSGSTNGAAAASTSGAATTTGRATAPPSSPAPATPLDANPASGSGGALPGGAGLALGGILVVGIGTAATLRARRNRAP